MKKVKNIITTVVCILLAVTLCGVMAMLFRKPTIQDPNDSTSSDSSSEAVTYAITYRMVSDGTEEEVYAPLFKANGIYPTRYAEGESVTVSDLNGRTTRTPLSGTYDGLNGLYLLSGEFNDPYDAYRTFEFFGWYLDPECSIELENNTFQDKAEDITLYAKISIGIWTKAY